MFFISPPFGNYISRPNAISIAGSYTLNQRRGRAIRVIKSLRPIKDGWVNKIGLRNCGIKNVSFVNDKIYSIAAFRNSDWEEFLSIIPETVFGVELNLGCPNEGAILDIGKQVEKYVKKYRFVSLKLSPSSLALLQVDGGLCHGVKYFHLCNTLSTQRGGESGKRLKKISLMLIREARKCYGDDFEIIAGGGIYSIEDVKDYQQAGANHFSLATIWFKPLTALRVLREASILNLD